MQSDAGNSTSGEQNKSVDLTELKAALLLTLDLGCELIKELAERPAEVGEALVQKASEEGKKAVDKGIEAAKQHPLAALLIAFGLGFLVVKYLNRKS